MTEQELFTKNLKLSREFDLYLVEHPEGGGADSGECVDRPAAGGRSGTLCEESGVGAGETRAGPSHRVGAGRHAHAPSFAVGQSEGRDRGLTKRDYV